MMRINVGVLNNVVPETIVKMLAVTYVPAFSLWLPRLLAA